MAESDLTKWHVSDLADIEAKIICLPVTPENIATFFSAISDAKRILAVLAAMVQDRALEYVKEHGSFKVGDTMYSIGRDKSVKCRDSKAALEHLLDVFEGDSGKIAECLSANAWKPGAVRVFLAEVGKEADFDQLFKTEVKEKVEGKEKVTATDLRFIAGQPAGKKGQDHESE